jgi:ADP-ribose pyrophosphatase YjhB (NUDIX family)
MTATRLLFPLVSADVALFTVIEETLRVLLVQRSQEPELRLWAMPGAVLNPEFDLDMAATARRALRDKVSVEIAHLAQVGAASGRTRDPRGWSLSVLFYALLPLDQVNAVVRRDVEAIKWADAGHPGQELAFDHRVQIGAALAALRAKVESHALPLHLLPERFTLTQLQRTCEAVLGHALDKSVFRRRLKGSEDLLEIPGEFVMGPQRPAQLYRARDGFVF